MRDTIIHRGPDGFGTWISDDSKVGFGHRRLPIIDLSEAAAQPKRNADRSLWLTFYIYKSYWSIMLLFKLEGPLCK